MNPVRRPPEGDEGPVDAEGPVRSRTDDKKQRVATEAALAELSERLLGLQPKVLAALDLDEDALGAIEEAQRIQSAPARGRALRRVRSTLRGTDWVTLLRRLDALAGGIAKTALSDTEAARYAALLAAQGDPGLVAFLEEFPSADRGRLRQLMLSVRRAPEAKREKVRQKLEAVVQAIMEEHSAERTADGAFPEGSDAPG